MIKPESTAKFNEKKQSSNVVDVEKLKKFAAKGEVSLDLSAKPADRPRKAYFDKYFENIKASSTKFSRDQNAFIEAVSKEVYGDTVQTAFSLLLRESIELLNANRDDEVVQSLVYSHIGFLKEKSTATESVGKTYLLTNNQREMLDSLTTEFKNSYLLKRKDVLLLAVMLYAENEVGMDVSKVISGIMSKK